MAAVIDIATAERLQGPSERRTHLRVIPGGLADDDRRGLSGARGIESARTVSARTYLVRRIAVLSVAGPAGASFWSRFGPKSPTELAA